LRMRRTRQKGSAKENRPALSAGWMVTKLRVCSLLPPGESPRAHADLERS
jgi:hypothetical protein